MSPVALLPLAPRLLRQINVFSGEGENTSRLEDVCPALEDVPGLAPMRCVYRNLEHRSGK
jgi:hypothetical protein